MRDINRTYFVWIRSAPSNFAREESGEEPSCCPQTVLAFESNGLPQDATAGLATVYVRMLNQNRDTCLAILLAGVALPEL